MKRLQSFGLWFSSLDLLPQAEAACVFVLQFDLIGVFIVSYREEFTFQTLEMMAMLVSFTFENWKSYRDETTLSMIADRSRQHGETLAFSPYYRGMKFLPVAAIYGGNAAGKSNLFDAIRFVQRFVILGRQDYSDIPVEPFAWGSSGKEPSRFAIQILVTHPGTGELCPSRTLQRELIYQLEFRVNRQQVLEESLSWFDSQRHEHEIYHRNAEGDVMFSSELRSKVGAEQIKTLQVLAKGAGQRRLFLTNTASQQLPLFRHIYDWFRNDLRTADNATPAPRIAKLMDDQEYCDRFGRILHALGTGVDHVRLEPTSLESLPADQREQLKNLADQMQENSMIQAAISLGYETSTQIFVITKHNGDVTVRHVQTYRNDKPFGFERESSGTRRLIEILPIFLDLWMHDSCTWVLDEMEREFHTEMTWALLEGFLENCGQRTRKQALLNTHDLMLMDQDLFRKDEILVAERDNDGVSHLISLGDYEGIRNDLDLRRSYLDGRFGGRPDINANEFEEAINGGK